MHNESSKKLLISSYAPPALGGPQNLYNLLRDTNPDFYCILTSFYNIDNLSAKIGNWLKGEYIFYDSTLTIKDIIKNYKTNSISKKRALVSKLKHFAKRSILIREIIGIVIISSQIIAIVSKGIKTIKDKKIDSIIAFSDYGPAMIGAYILQKITKKPYSIFLFDLYKGNSLPFPGKILANIFEPFMFKSAKYIVLTNEGTRDFYSKIYSKKILKKMIVIHNSVFPESYLNRQISENTQSSYTILFTGRIYWPQIGSLKNLIKAVEEIDDTNIKLKIYSPSPKEYLKEIGIEESEKIKIGVASPEEMPLIQGNADILFLPLSWHIKSQAIIDTATPGKLTDYLIAGKPILIHAPASTYIAKYAKENNFAEVVDEENIEKLKLSIRKLLTNKEFSDTIIKNARETFFKNHDANKNAETFRKIFELYL